MSKKTRTKKNPISFLILFLISIQYLWTQTIHEQIWDALLRNDRQTAIKLARTLGSKHDIESVVLGQIIRYESGQWSRDKNFYQRFVRLPDFEFYLYALKNEPYFFGNLDHNDEFNNDILENVDEFYKLKFKHPTIRLIMQDLKGTADYYRNNFKHSIEIFNAMPAISKWQYLGMFENMNHSGINIVYEPESKAKSINGYNANSNGTINWFVPASLPPGPYVHPLNMDEYGSGIFYTQTFVNNPREQDVYLRFSASDAQKVWINDVLVFENTHKERQTEFDYYTVKLHLPRGINRLLVKTTHNGSFVMRITDQKGTTLPDLKYSDQYAPYVKSDPKMLNPILIPNEFESYFEKLAQQHPQNFFYDFMLIKTYLRNSQIEKAKALIKKHLKKFPKSSLLRTMLMKVYEIEENQDKINQLRENMINDDPYYFQSILFKLSDQKKLFQKDISQFNQELDRMEKATQIPDIIFMTKLTRAIRTQDAKLVYTLLSDYIDYAEKNSKISEFVNLGFLWAENFKQMPNFKARLQSLANKYFHGDIISGLFRIYSNENANKQLINLAEKLHKKIPYRNDFIQVITDTYISLKKYKDALPYVDKALANFPYSFTFMETKGTILQHLNQKSEAIHWYEKALSHNSANADLRQKIRDLKGLEDPLQNFAVKDYYQYIKNNRGKIQNNNYGVNQLLEQHLVHIYKEGGYKHRRIYINEVTSDKGIERMKESNYNTNGYTVFIKSEIVKPDGTVVPANRQGGHLVFSGLEKGDVILVDVESTIAETGRFYKDFEHTFSINGFDPAKLYHLVILAPKNMHLNHITVNGPDLLKVSAYRDWNKYEWKQTDVNPLPAQEPYMPRFPDVANRIHFSSIDSWDKIAYWYRDLSHESIQYNDVVNKTFDEIFPNGYQNLSEPERAKRIYDWMHKHLSYSFVDFRQSGFIPQKPAHVIESKLGDCKDFSTLFLALGRKAGLKVNLVLVNTNDNGELNPLLPSIGFNHAIVRVMLDGQKNYLELTDKYLPFRALPTTLIHAAILEIPFDKNDDVEHGLLHLDTYPQIEATRNMNIIYTIGANNKQTLEIDYTSSGRINSSLNHTLDEDNEEQLKKQIRKFFENFDDLDLQLLDYQIVNKNPSQPQSKIRVKFKINNKLKKLGGTYIIKLPLMLNPYTPDIIKLDERKYPIKYVRYENTDRYYMHYIIRLKNGKSFKAIPQSQEFSYKNHSYRARFHKVSPYELKVDISVHTPINDIPVSDYPAYKTYVQKVLENMDELIGFE